MIAPVHTVSVERKTGGVWSEQIAEVRGIVELMKGTQKVSLLGIVDSAAYRFTWRGSEELKNGDRTIWDGRKWMVGQVGKDSTSPWMTSRTCIFLEIK